MDAPHLRQRIPEDPGGPMPHPAFETGRGMMPTAGDARIPCRTATPDRGSPGGRPMRLWAMSDLRIDTSAFTFPEDLPDFDAIIVAGGVSTCLEASLRWLAHALDGRHGSRPVILVPGAHEFWNGRPKAETLRRGRALAADLGIALLSDAVVRLDDGHGGGVHVVGATLWSDWALNGPPKATNARAYARYYHADCKRISLGLDTPYLPHDAAGAHARSRAFIEDVLSSVVVQASGFGVSPVALIQDAVPGDRAVVVTHHAPTGRSLPDHLFETCDEWVPASLASDLEGIMGAWGAPRIWIHGHVPRAVDIRIGKTRVVANPRCTERGAAPFDPTLIVEA